MSNDKMMRQFIESTQKGKKSKPKPEPEPDTSPEQERGPTDKKPSWRDLYPVHPAADIFPMLPEDELRKLGEDIEKKGLIDPIVLWSADKSQQGYLLDGRNRLAAMELVGIDHRRTEHLYGDRVDPLDYVISKNIRRRHLTKEQQADLIVKVALAERLTSPSLARSFSPEPSKRGGSTTDSVKAKVIEEAEKRGISKRTAERSLAKARGASQKPRELKSDLDGPAKAAATCREFERRVREELSALPSTQRGTYVAHLGQYTGDLLNEIEDALGM